MAKNANKILKEIAVKMGGNVGEKDNDTNELLASIATSLGATPDSKKNSNELLELISENVSAGGSSGGTSLPLGQTNPDCYFYKVFDNKNHTITIDFTKFADWYDNLDGIMPGDTHALEWGVMGSGSSVSTNTYDLASFEFGYSLQTYGKEDHIYLDVNSTITLTIQDSGYNNIYSTQLVASSNDKTVIECLREVGVVNINLDEISFNHYYDYLDDNAPCILYRVYGVWYDKNDGIMSHPKYNNVIEYINSIDWLKISAKN